MQTTVGLLQVEVVELWSHIIVLEKEESGEEVWEHLSLLGRQFICQLLEYAQMRIVCPLNEAVEKHNHLVELEDVISHGETELLNSILEEEKLCALWVCIEELVCNL